MFGYFLIAVIIYALVRLINLLARLLEDKQKAGMYSFSLFSCRLSAYLVALLVGIGIGVFTEVFINVMSSSISKKMGVFGE
jgi:hypothetical protein